MNLMALLTRFRHRPLQLNRVTVHVNGGPQTVAQVDARVGRRLRRRDGFRNHGDEIDALHFQWKLARHDVAHVEQVVDHLRLPSALRSMTSIALRIVSRL